ncbi:MAG: PepSY domain-containing protein [Chthoniobacterales bacterium]
MKPSFFACCATAVAVASATSAFAESDAQLMKEAKVTKTQAEQTALAKVPRGKITSEEIERESGKLIWSFDIAKTGTKNITEVQVDAITGAVASAKTETPKDQASEAAADRAAKK